MPRVFFVTSRAVGCNKHYVTAVLLKHGRPVAKSDPWIPRATQGPTIDGPFGDQWILNVLQKIFRNETGYTVPPMHWYHMSVCTCVLSKRHTPIGSFWPILIDFTVWADYWITDHPELRRTTQASTMGGPLGEPGFCIFRSTGNSAVFFAQLVQADNKENKKVSHHYPLCEGNHHWAADSHHKGSVMRKVFPLTWHHDVCRWHKLLVLLDLVTSLCFKELVIKRWF